MTQTEPGKAGRRSSFKSLSPAKKAEHIWYYHKWKIIFGLIALILIGTTVHQLLHRKEILLYLGMTNVTLSSELEETLTTGYLEDAGFDPGKTEFYIYHDLYLSEDAEGDAHRSAYASRIKLMASVEQQCFDAVFMSRQAYDILSAQGYLMDLEALLENDPDLKAELEPFLAENEVYLEDNAISYELNEADSHEIISETVINAVRLDELPFYRSAGFREQFYFGLIANTPRTQACLSYLEFLIR